MREACPWCGGELDDGIPCAPRPPPRPRQPRGTNVRGEYPDEVAHRLARNLAWRARPWWYRLPWEIAHAMGLTRA